QSPYEVTMPLKNRLLARSRDERKPTLALPIFGDVKLTKDIAQHARRGRENSAAIAAFARMAHAIRRFLGKEHCLIHIGGHAAPAEVFAKGAMPHKHDVVASGVLLAPQPTATGATTIVAHAYDGAVVQRVKADRVLDAGRHEDNRT